MPRLVSAEVLSTKYDIKLETIWRLTRQKKIPHVKIGRQYRYDENAVLRSLMVAVEVQS